MLKVGDLVDGKYKILNKVGQGGMSVVYLAMNERANKQWAIKEVRKDGVSDFEVVKQNLVAETDILKKLNHRHLPSIIDVIDMEESFLIVMDYIEGITLKQVLEREGVQPQERVVEWAKQICDVLGYLHSRKPPIVYRDMKPSNVMLKPDGNITVFDFGTAREYKSGNSEDTTCLGTKGYAAPEQYGGRGQTDARTDIYCLGATLYHLLTGHNPSQPPYEMRPIRKWNPNLSSGLERIILKCTAADPNDRYQTCAELMYALDHYTELDDEYRKKQNTKWKAFIATSTLTVVSLLACIGCKLLENSTIKNSYGEYIKSAERTEDEDEFIKNYKNAINLNPKDETGYLGLLDKMLATDETGESGECLSQEEANQITEILGYKGDGNTTNESKFSSNKEGYEEFAYELGIAYYYHYDGKGNKQLSKEWFEIAAESSSLASNKVERSKRFAKIANYYAQLNVRDETGDSMVSYSDYWKDMKELVSGNLVKLDNETIAIAMYQDMIYQIGQYALNFKDAGVSKAELVNELEDMESHIKSDISGSGGDKSYQKNIKNRKKSLLENAQWAKEQVDVAYSSQSKSSKSQED